MDVKGCIWVVSATSGDVWVSRNVFSNLLTLLCRSTCFISMVFSFFKFVLTVVDGNKFGNNGLCSRLARFSEPTKLLFFLAG